MSRAADLGYRSVFLADHLGGQLAPLLAAAYASAVDTQMRFGLLVANTLLRHPVVLAKEAATLDVLSGGRFDLGVGAGWLSTDLSRTGTPQLSRGDRVRRLEEYVAILRLYWSSSDFSYEGEFFNLSGVMCEPRPASPLSLIVGGGSRRVLTLAGRMATIASLDVPHIQGTFDRREYLAGAGSQAFAQRANWVTEAAAAEGNSVTLQMLVLSGLVSLDCPFSATEAIAREWNVTPKVLLDSPAALVGDTDEVCDRLLDWRQRTGVSYYVVQGSSLVAAAPIVERLTGR